MRAYISANGINVFEVLEQLRDDIRALPEEVEGFAKKIFYSKEVQDFIIASNIRLLEHGLRPDGSEISKEPVGNQKSPLYERYTIYNREQGGKGYRGGQQTEFVDLYKSGFFYGSLKVRAGSNELLEFSDDPKSIQLEAIWGQILGISDEDVLQLILMLRPKIIKFVKDKLKIQK